MTGVVSLAVTLPRPGSRAAIPRAPSTGEDPSNSFFTHDTGPLVIITCICRTLNILVQKDRNRLSTILRVRWQASLLVIKKSQR